MTYTVATTFSSKGYKNYAHRMLETFGKFWPKEIKLWAHYESLPQAHPGVEYHDLFKSSPNLKSFVERNRNNPKDESFSIKRRENGGFYWPIEHAGIRFAFKVFTIIHAIKNSKTDYVIWLDADTITTAPVTYEFLEKVCPPDALLSYLGRDNLYPETGWVAYNRNHPKINDFISALENLYNTDDIYNQRQYHDCVALEVTMKKIDARYYDIARENGIHTNDPFKKTILGQYLKHYKGRQRITLWNKIKYFTSKIRN